MKNDNWQLVSLDLAKKMKEVGFKQESLWWWVSIRNGEPEILTDSQFGMLECNTPHAYKRICSAYTVAELLHMLPIDNIWFRKVNRMYNGFYEGNSRCHTEGKTPAHCLGYLLIHLKEKGLK